MGIGFDSQTGDPPVFERKFFTYENHPNRRHALPADSTHYPDSGKWALMPARKVFRMTEADYYDGEE